MIATAGFRARVSAVGVAVATSLALSGCGDDASAAVRDGVLTVAVSDFSFGDLPDDVPVGTRLEIENTSNSELHELVAVRLADDDDRPIGDVVHTVHELFEAGPPAAVLLAAPSGEQIAAVGDGTLLEPGRYLIVCSIPTGVDPAEFLTASGDGDGPPDVGATGAPHYEHGMFAELEVTDR